MRFVGRGFRAHDPAWSFTPLSGAGAAATGGRFNRKGAPTLYLSLDVMTSFGECTQGFTNRLQPLTMCEYDVDCEGIADLRDDAARAAHGVTRDELACSWLTFQIAGKTAPSWLAIDRLRMAGHTGILVSSFVPGATEANINLVLWRWGPDLPHKVDVFDPSSVAGATPQSGTAGAATPREQGRASKRRRPAGLDDARCSLKAGSRPVPYQPLCESRSDQIHRKARKAGV